MEKSRTKCIPVPDKKKQMKASFILAHEIAEAKKPQSDGVFIKKCMVKVLIALDENNAAKIIESLSAPCTTISSRITLISSMASQTLREELAKCKYFSLGMDESTDVTDVAQLIISIRYVNDHFEIGENILNTVSLLEHTRGTDIYSIVLSEIDRIGYRGKFVSVTTDGASSMIGAENGLVGLLDKNNMMSKNIYQMELLELQNNPLLQNNSKIGVDFWMQ